jgi:Protein of unknown function (DUF3293)
LFPAANRVRTVYTETDYIVWSDRQEMIIRVGERSASIEHLLSRFKTRSGAFVTAWNPFGKSFSNNHAQRRLLSALRRKALAYAHGEGRGRIGGWTPERSVLVFNMRRSDAARLGRSLRQNAIVFVRIGRPAELVPLR